MDNTNRSGWGRRYSPPPMPRGGGGGPRCGGGGGGDDGGSHSSHSSSSSSRRNRNFDSQRHPQQQQWGRDREQWAQEPPSYTMASMANRNNSMATSSFQNNGNYWQQQQQRVSSDMDEFGRPQRRNFSQREQQQPQAIRGGGINVAGAAAAASMRFPGSAPAASSSDGSSAFGMNAPASASATAASAAPGPARSAAVITPPPVSVLRKKNKSSGNAGSKDGGKEDGEIAIPPKTKKKTVRFSAEIVTKVVERYIDEPPLPADINNGNVGHSHHPAMTRHPNASAFDSAHSNSNAATSTQPHALQPTTNPHFSVAANSSSTHPQQKRIRNMCRLTGHTHPWHHCPNNFHGGNYCGVDHRTMKLSSDPGEVARANASAQAAMEKEKQQAHQPDNNHHDGKNNNHGVGQQHTTTNNNHDMAAAEQRRLTIPCRTPGHHHPWYYCPHNRYGGNDTGKLYSNSDADVAAANASAMAAMAADNAAAGGGAFGNGTSKGGGRTIIAVNQTDNHYHHDGNNNTKNKHGRGLQYTSNNNINMCRLNGHLHPWHHCPYNRNSFNFQGVEYRDRNKSNFSSFAAEVTWANGSAKAAMERAARGCCESVNNKAYKDSGKEGTKSAMSRDGETGGMATSQASSSAAFATTGGEKAAPTENARTTAIVMSGKNEEKRMLSIPKKKSPSNAASASASASASSGHATAGGGVASAPAATPSIPKKPSPRAAGTASAGTSAAAAAGASTSTTSKSSSSILKQPCTTATALLSHIKMTKPLSLASKRAAPTSKDSSSSIMFNTSNVARPIPRKKPAVMSSDQGAAGLQKKSSTGSSSAPIPKKRKFQRSNSQESAASLGSLEVKRPHLQQSAQPKEPQQQPQPLHPPRQPNPSQQPQQQPDPPHQKHQHIQSQQPSKQTIITPERVEVTKKQGQWRRKRVPRAPSGSDAIPIQKHTSTRLGKTGKGVFSPQREEEEMVKSPAQMSSPEEGEIVVGKTGKGVFSPQREEEKRVEPPEQLSSPEEGEIVEGSARKRRIESEESMRVLPEERSGEVDGLSDTEDGMEISNEEEPKKKKKKKHIRKGKVGEILLRKQQSLEQQQQTRQQQKVSVGESNSANNHSEASSEDGINGINESPIISKGDVGTVEDETSASESREKGNKEDVNGNGVSSNGDHTNGNEHANEAELDEAVVAEMEHDLFAMIEQTISLNAKWSRKIEKQVQRMRLDDPNDEKADATAMEMAVSAVPLENQNLEQNDTDRSEVGPVEDRGDTTDEESPNRTNPTSSGKQASNEKDSPLYENANSADKDIQHHPDPGNIGAWMIGNLTDGPLVNSTGVAPPIFDQGEVNLKTLQEAKKKKRKEKKQEEKAEKKQKKKHGKKRALDDKEKNGKTKKHKSNHDSGCQGAHGAHQTVDRPSTDSPSITPNSLEKENTPPFQRKVSENYCDTDSESSGNDDNGYIAFFTCDKCSMVFSNKEKASHHEEACTFANADKASIISTGRVFSNKTSLIQCMIDGGKSVTEEDMIFYRQNLSRRGREDASLGNTHDQQQGSTDSRH